MPGPERVGENFYRVLLSPLGPRPMKDVSPRLEWSGGRRPSSREESPTTCPNTGTSSTSRTVRERPSLWFSHHQREFPLSLSTPRPPPPIERADSNGSVNPRFRVRTFVVQVDVFSCPTSFRVPTRTRVQTVVPRRTQALLLTKRVERGREENSPFVKTIRDRPFTGDRGTWYRKGVDGRTLGRLTPLV